MIKAYAVEESSQRRKRKGWGDYDKFPIDEKTIYNCL